MAVDGDVLGLAASQALRAPAGRRRHRAARPTPTSSPTPGTSAPTLPQARVYEHAAPHAPQPRAAKLAHVRAAMAALGATHHFVSTVDDIAWITNLRGADVDYNPVFLAHLLIAADRRDAVRRRRQGRRRAAGRAGRRRHRAGRLRRRRRGARRAAARRACCWSTRAASRWASASRWPTACASIESINPSTLAKSRKSDAELAFVREAMAQDGAAMCAFYAWFDKATAPERPFGPVTEVTIDEKLSGERRKRPGFVGLSFPVIAGWNANGAMPHYRASARVARRRSRATACC